MSKPSLRDRIAAPGLALASAVLFGAVCVHWGLQIRQTLRPPADRGPESAPLGPILPAADPASLHLFGQSAVLLVPPPSAPPANLSLIGMIASRTPGAAVALLRVDGVAVALRSGDSVSPGIVLRAIERDRVMLEQNGQPIALQLSEPRGGVPGVAGSAALPLPGGLTGTPAAPRGLPGGAAPFPLQVQSLGPNHFGFSKAELSHALQDPKQAGALGRATPGPGGGLVLDEVPAGGLSEHIGLRAGDILRQANGQTLNSLTDLPRLYQEFGTATSVRLEIVRGGQAMILQYTVRP